MGKYNIYCDESNHLENRGSNIMVLGSLYCPKEKVQSINRRLREIKVKHNISPNTEIKWVKVSPNKIAFYLDVIDYFFDTADLHFRALIVDKSKLNHEAHNSNHDTFYYKMYFELLNKIFVPQDCYDIYLDIKDTVGGKKVKKLHEVLCNSMYDFDANIITKIQLVHSHEVEIMQVCDLLIGAVQFLNREDVSSEAKTKIVQRLRERSGYDLTKTTLLREEKTNLFYWKGQNI